MINLLLMDKKTHKESKESCWFRIVGKNIMIIMIIFYNQIVSKEIAMTKLEKEIKRFEEIFGTKFEEIKEK